MTRADIISYILLQNKYFPTLDDARVEVLKTFSHEFPNLAFEVWNTNHSEDLANKVIARFRDRQNLNIKYLIQDVEVLIRGIESVNQSSGLSHN